MQIPICQDNLEDEYTIDITNQIGQELCVTTDHIRFNDQSARKSRRLCDYAHLVKLNVGKRLFIKMKKVTNTPMHHDVFRAGLFIAIEDKSSNKKDNVPEGVLEFSHVRDVSVCKLTSYGSLSR
jgi:hypothetical protein